MLQKLLALRNLYAKGYLPGINLILKIQIKIQLLIMKTINHTYYKTTVENVNKLLDGIDIQPKIIFNNLLVYLLQVDHSIWINIMFSNQIYKNYRNHLYGLFIYINPKNSSIISRLINIYKISANNFM